MYHIFLGGCTSLLLMFSQTRMESSPWYMNPLGVGVLHDVQLFLFIFFSLCGLELGGGEGVEICTLCKSNLPMLLVH